MEHRKILHDLVKEYKKKFPRSGIIGKEAEKFLIDGGSHTKRLIDPYPVRLKSANGGFVTDEDGHQILDFWQGHYSNILGHNPEVVTGPLSKALGDGFGLQTGFTDQLQAEVAQQLCAATGSERVRFTTSGSLATMYAILLAKGFTGRNLVMKIGGGWHGAQPWGLKGVDFHTGTDRFDQVDSAGLSRGMEEEVLVTSFNDTSMLEEKIKKHGDKIACFILEPFIGAGGFLPTSLEYIKTARELTRKYGALLIFDEVISGFRFRAGSVASLYHVQPDLATYGKIIGGGMPLAAVAGKKEIMSLASKEGGPKVRFSGGTFSAHPATMLAAKYMMKYLSKHEGEIYPRIGALGEKVRKTIERVFASEGIFACCTGYGNDAIEHSSLAMVFFPHREGRCIKTPSETRDPKVVDVELGNQILKMSLLLDDIHAIQGFGSVSAAHDEKILDAITEGIRRFVERIGR